MSKILNQIPIGTSSSLALSNFALAITEAANEKQIYIRMAEFLPEILIADRTSVTLLKEDNNKLEVFALHGSEGALPVGKDLPVELSLAGNSIRQGNTCWYEIDDQNLMVDAKQLYQQGIRSIMNSPIKFSDRIIGSLNIGSFKENVYNSNSAEVMTLITTLVSTYLERHHLLEKAQTGVKQYKSYSEQLEALNHTAEKLSSATSEEDALLIITESASEIIRAQRISYFVSHTEHFEVKAMCSEDERFHMPDIVPMEGTSLQFGLKTGAPAFYSDFHDTGFNDHKLLYAKELVSGWSVPVRIKDDIVGFLNAASSHKIIDGAQQLGILKMLSGIMGATLTRIKLQTELEYHARYDALTGLANRSQFNNVMEVAIAKEEPEPFTLLFIDLDRFKMVNDSMGHDIGDELLCMVTQRLKHQVRENDFISRHGGDEFVVLLHNCKCPEVSKAMSTRIIEALKKPFEINERLIFIGASIGISHFPTDSDKSEELLKYADIAMYHAKNHGRNTFQLYSSKLLEKVNSKQRIDEWLRLAIENDELYLQYQPLIHDDAIKGVEALLRWRHPVLGEVSPSVFIPIAEENLLIEDITHWVINESLLTIKHLRKKYPDLYVSVNISAKDCLNPVKLQACVLNAIQQNDLPGAALQIEITENVLLNNIDKVNQLLLNLKLHGIRFAIDDFGTGFSSLTYLLSLPFDTLKVDQSFIKDIQNDKTRFGVVKGIFVIAKSLSVDCIAEGIETLEQKNCLKKLGCSQFQGYWFSRPLLEKDLLIHLAANQT